MTRDLLRASIRHLLPMTVVLTSHSAIASANPHNKHAAPAKRQIVRVCVGNEDWFPFSYMEGNKPVGVHVDLATMAIKAAGFDVKFTAMPWQKCVNDASRKGRFDAPLSASWRNERQSYLMFPAKAEAEGPKCKSKESLMCNGHIVVVPSGSEFHFTGDLTKIPAPIRIVTGYNEVKEYRDRGVRVETGPDDETNLNKMLKANNGSALMLVQSAHQFNSRPEFKNKFRIIENYEDFADSFLPFTKKGKVSKTDAEKIWAEVAKLRKYPVVLDNAIKRHQATRPDQIPSTATRAGRPIVSDHRRG